MRERGHSARPRQTRRPKLARPERRNLASATRRPARVPPALSCPLNPIRIMRQVWSAALLFACTLLASSLQAQTIPSSFEYVETKNTVGLFGEYIAIDAGSQELGPDAAALFGVRYGMHLNGPLSVEASVAYGKTDRTIRARRVATEPELIAVGETDVGLLIADAGFQFHLTGPRTWHNLRPFILGSIGVVTDLSGTAIEEVLLEDSQVFDFGPGFAASAGLGLEFFLTDQLSMRAEGRDRLWRYKYPAGLSSAGEEETEWAHNVGFSVGAAFHF